MLRPGAVSPTVDDTGAAIGLHALDDQDMLVRAAPAADPQRPSLAFRHSGGTTLASSGDPHVVDQQVG